MKDKLILDTAIVFLGTSLGGVFNLIYHLVTVRLLTPQNYGTFNALISVIMFGSMAIAPLFPTLTRFFTEYITKKEFISLVTVFKKLINRLLILGVAIFLFFVIFSPCLGDFLNTKGIYVFSCGIVIVLSLLSPLIMSLLRSFQEFKYFSSIVILSPLGKLIIGTIFMFLGFEVLGGLSGFLAYPVVILIMGMFFILNIFRAKEIYFSKDNISHHIELLPIYKYFFPVALAMFSFTLLTNIDVILVKHFFSSLDAGYYSIAQMVGKIFLYLPAALAIVIFPKTTAAYVSNSHSHKILYKSLLLAGFICIIGVMLCFLFPNFVLSILTAKSNPVSIRLVGLFSLAMSFYALVWIIVNYLLAIHNLRFVIPFIILSILETVFIYLYHPNLSFVLWVFLSFSIITFLMAFFVGVKKRLKVR